MILWQRAFSAIISSSKNIHNVITTPKMSRNNKPKGKPKPFDQPSSPYNYYPSTPGSQPVHQVNPLSLKEYANETQTYAGNFERLKARRSRQALLRAIGKKKK